ncbi:GATA-type zinc finger transcription factor [Phycomyces blakesleeanus]
MDPPLGRNTFTNDRFSLPPISTIDDSLPSRSWPPPATTLHQVPFSSPPNHPENWSPSSTHSETRDYFFNRPVDHHHRQRSLPQFPTMYASNSPQELPSPVASRSVENDIDDVIRHCSALGENMVRRKSRLSDPYYLSDLEHTRPWLDDMISRANQVLNALLRLRKHQMAAEYVRAHGIDSRRRAGTSQAMEIGGPSERAGALLPLGNGPMSLHSIRQRKRGKRATFQGRCHSCNISETPEWRRGPDGARTLCNACGLHYAKITRKRTDSATAAAGTMSVEDDRESSKNHNNNNDDDDEDESCNTRLTNRNTFSESLSDRDSPLLSDGYAMNEDDTS